MRTLVLIAAVVVLASASAQAGESRSLSTYPVSNDATATVQPVANKSLRADNDAPAAQKDQGTSNQAHCAVSPHRSCLLCSRAVGRTAGFRDPPPPESRSSQERCRGFSPAAAGRARRAPAHGWRWRGQRRPRSGQPRRGGPRRNRGGSSPCALRTAGSAGPGSRRAFRRP